MRLVLLLVTLFLVGCKHSNSQSKNDSLNQIEDSLIFLIDQISKSPQIDLPIGDSLILSSFSKEWDWKEVDNNSEKILSSLSNKLDSSSLEILHKKKTLFIGKKYLHYFFDTSYDIPFNIDKSLNDRVKTGAYKIKESKKYQLYYLVIEPINLDCNNCEYRKRLLVQSLISIKNNTIIDKLITSYIEGNDIGRSYRFFFYDKNGNIQIKDFGTDELGGSFLSGVKYQITSQGKFIRYYDENGRFKNEEEQGIVENHTREGKWIEIRYNKYLNLDKYKDIFSMISYLEAEYKEGLPIGEFKYYNLEQEYNDKGEPILSTRKKGNLIYTETYENGELKERKFVK